VADLPSERPNCYLEVGYALGVGKFTNLVLTEKRIVRRRLLLGSSA
jgi:hypothetical protein